MTEGGRGSGVSTKLLLDVPSGAPAMGFDNIARALRNIVLHSEPRFAIGIFGGWGSGKTTLMDAIARELPSENVISVSFSPWRYEREEHLIVPLLDTIREALVEWADSSGTDRDAQLTARRTATVVGRAMRSIVAGFSVKAGLPGALELSFDANRALQEGALRRGAEREARVPRSFYHASFRALEHAFDEFVKAGESDRRIVVFVDDLDRCLPESALQVLESMKLFFDLKGFVFVVALDQRVIEHVVDRKYLSDSTPSPSGSRELPKRMSGAEYIKKVFQLPYHLAPLSRHEIGAFLTVTYEEADLPMGQRAALNETLEPHLRFLVGDLPINPRELKRYINLYTLQTQINDELDPDVVLALQTMSFRDDWSGLRADIVEFPQEMIDGLRRRSENSEADFTHLDLGEQLGAVPDEFLEYVAEDGPAHALLIETNLDRYLLSGEAVQSARDPSLLEALHLVGQIREVLASAGSGDVGTWSREVSELISKLDRRLAPAVERLAHGPQVLHALTEFQDQFAAVPETDPDGFAARDLIENAKLLSARLRRLLGTGDLGRSVLRPDPEPAPSRERAALPLGPQDESVATQGDWAPSRPSWRSRRATKALLEHGLRAAALGDALSRRYLPPTTARSLPDVDAATQLFVPTGGIGDPKATVLFAHFAQWFTEGYGGTEPHPSSREDAFTLWQLYGETPEETYALRGDGVAGELASQVIAAEEFPPYLYEQGTVKPSFERVRRSWVAGLTDDRRDSLFATGGQVPTLGSSMMNVLLLREHNRLARELAAHHPRWDDQRLFQTARRILTVVLMKIVVEEFLGTAMSQELRLGAPTSLRVVRAWRGMELDLAYSWQSLLPSTFLIDGRQVAMRETWLDTGLLTRHGLGPLFDDASRERAGRCGLFNTDPALLIFEREHIQRGRELALRSYNDYRELFGFRRATSVEQISADPRILVALRESYGNVDDVEFHVGLFAEDRPNHWVLPPLLSRMVAGDLLAQVQTHPLLARNAYTESNLSTYGVETIATTNSLAQLVHRNLPAAETQPLVSMTRAGWQRA